MTKLGGQPVWVDKPQWPLSTELETPMMFLGQFRLPGEEVRMAYLFMTGSEDYVDGTWDSEEGENALIVQPGRVPSFITVTDDAEGPTMSEDLAVELVPCALPSSKRAGTIGLAVLLRGSKTRSIRPGIGPSCSSLTAGASSTMSTSATPVLATDFSAPTAKRAAFYGSAHSAMSQDVPDRMPGLTI
ncbi:hypothetical protein ACFQX6_41145 [Streptosporangium lutulentum]